MLQSKGRGRRPPPPLDYPDDYVNHSLSHNSIYQDNLVQDSSVNQNVIQNTNLTTLNIVNLTPHNGNFQAAKAETPEYTTPSPQYTSPQSSSPSQYGASSQYVSSSGYGGPSSATTYNSVNFPPTPSDTVGAGHSSFVRRKLHIDTDIQLTASTTSSVNTSDFDMTNGPMTGESQFYMNSPKPMGPKELIDYSVLSVSREALRRRSFQQLSRPESRSTELEPQLQSQSFVLDTDPLQQQQQQQYEYSLYQKNMNSNGEFQPRPSIHNRKLHRSSHPNVPYPVDLSEELEQGDYEDLPDTVSPDFDVIKEYNFLRPEVVLHIDSPTPPPSETPPQASRTQQIINESIITPTKISPLRNSIYDTPPSYNGSYSVNDSGLTGSPPRRSSISPARNDTFLSSRKHSPNRDSRDNSKSPKFRSSPSLSYDFPIAQRTFVEGDSDDDEGYSYDTTRQSATEYSIINQEMGGQACYPEEDNVDLFDDESIIHPSTFFGRLPTLPSPGTSPTRNNTFSYSPNRDLMTSITRNSTLYSVSQQRKDEDLPALPFELPPLPFSAKSLNNQHFSVFNGPLWSLKSIFEWSIKLQDWLDDLFISLAEFKVALTDLVTYHKPDIPPTVLSTLVDSIVDSLLRSHAISLTYRVVISPNNASGREEENGITIDEMAAVSGVFPALTTCYYSGSHDKAQDLRLKCYSRFCHWNAVIEHEEQLKNLDENEIYLAQDWVSYWKVTDVKTLDKRVVTLQSHVLDLLRNEWGFSARARLFVEDFGPQFFARAKTDPKIKIPSNYQNEVIDSRSELLEIHKTMVLDPLIEIYKSDGKFVHSFDAIAKIYSKWTKKAEQAFMRYMSTVPLLYELLNVEFLKEWVAKVHDKRLLKLNADCLILFQSTFSSRAFKLPLELRGILDLLGEEDKQSLAKAVEDVQNLTSKIQKMKVSVENKNELRKLQEIKWGNFNKERVNLKSTNRRFIKRGPLVRRGELKINTYNNHVILLDNYFIITERSRNRAINEYIVEKNPIPVELLLVEERESSSKTISHSPVTSGPSQNQEEEPSNYQFKVRYAGRGKRFAFTFITKSEKDRADWIRDIKYARTALCSRLRRTEPYSLNLISNTCFGYEQIDKIEKLPICAEQDPVYDLSVDTMKKLNFLSGSDIYSLAGSVVFSKVLSMCSFEFMGSQFVLIGLASGLYCSDLQNKWRKVANGANFVSLATDTSMSLLLVLAGNRLLYYALDLIVDVYYERRKHLTSVQLASKASFFEIGKHRAMTMIFVAKANSSGTDFTVFIPETDNGGVFSTFKEYKKFHVAAACYGVSLFNSSFAVHTNRGIEILNLSTLLPRSVPEFSNTESLSRRSSTTSANSNSNNIEAIRLAVVATGIKPMGMFKISRGQESDLHEFLLVYSNFAIFIDPLGKLSRSSILRFEFQAKSIAFVKNSLFLVCDEVIEIWRISEFSNGSNGLIQVITGKGIQMINSDKLAFSMANPMVPGMQLVFELRKKSSM